MYVLLLFFSCSQGRVSTVVLVRQGKEEQLQVWTLHNAKRKGGKVSELAVILQNYIVENYGMDSMIATLTSHK